MVPVKKVNYKSWGCKKVKKIYEKKNFKYFQCIDSKTIFANPRPKPEVLEKFYSNTESSNFWFNEFFMPKLKARKNKIFKPRVDFLHLNFSEYKKKKI